MVAKQILFLISLFLKKSDNQQFWKAVLVLTHILMRLALSPLQNPLGVVWLSLTGN